MAFSVTVFMIKLLHIATAAVQELHNAQYASVCMISGRVFPRHSVAGVRGRIVTFRVYARPGAQALPGVTYAFN